MDPVTNSTVGLEDVSDEIGAFTVYPNPSNDKVFVTSDIEGEGQAEVTNSIGQVVYSENVKIMDFHIDVSGFTSGVYFLKINTSSGVSMSKFVVE